MRRRVVVTGTGVVSPLGNNVETLWKNIKNGKSGIKRLESEEFKDIEIKMAGYIDDFHPEKLSGKKRNQKIRHIHAICLCWGGSSLETGEAGFRQCG